MANESIKVAFQRLWEHTINKIEERVKKEDGKGLSTNDFTDEYKNKVDYTTGKIGIQPDWNLNDETAIDYIKNRTHWSEGELREILAEEYGLTAYIPEGNEHGAPRYILKTLFFPKDLKEYEIIINNESFRCTVLRNDETGLFEFLSNDEVPFVNLKTNIETGRTSFSYITTDGLTDSLIDNITIIEINEEIHKLDSKYLPNFTKNLVDGDKSGSIRTINSNSQYIGINAFAQGKDTIALGESSHAEGSGADSFDSNAETIYVTYKAGEYSCTNVYGVGPERMLTGSVLVYEGRYIPINDSYSYLEYYPNYTKDIRVIFLEEPLSYDKDLENEPVTCIFSSAYGKNSHIEGSNSAAIGSCSHAEGYKTVAFNNRSHAEGTNSIAFGLSSHAEGRKTQAFGEGSHSEGTETVVYGQGSHAEGIGTGTTAEGAYITPPSHGVNFYIRRLEDEEGGYLYECETLYGFEQCKINRILQYNSFSALVIDNDVNNLTFRLNWDLIFDHDNTWVKVTVFGGLADGEGAHTEGYCNTSLEKGAHAEGHRTFAYGTGAHAEGSKTIALGEGSHAEGIGTQAFFDALHALGSYNIEDNDGTYAHIVGNGTAYDERSNAHTLDWNGNAWFAGDVYIGGTGLDNSDKLATEKKVETSITSPKDYFALTDTDNGYTYIVLMKNGNLVSRCGVSNIKVTTMPNKIEYYLGEYFDPTGMVVTATCEDGSIIDVTNYISDNKFVIDGNTVTILYNEAGNTYTTTITVNIIEFDAATILIDFEYIANDDGTYTITAWKGTKNGIASTEMVVPDISNIIL